MQIIFKRGGKSKDGGMGVSVEKSKRDEGCGGREEGKKTDK